MRVINAELAQEIADKELTAEEAGAVQYVLAHTPTVDAEPVRCENCLFSEQCQPDGEWYDCMHDHGLVGICKGTDFCSYGKSKGAVK